jgi:hypothetical protein
MESLAQVILFNTPLSTFKPHELIQLSLTSREWRMRIHERIAYLSSNYSTWLASQPDGREVTAPSIKSKKHPCVKCDSTKGIKHNPFTDQDVCPLHFGELITLTQARKEYKLTDEDLKALNHLSKWVLTYRQYITLFYKRDVVGLAMLKHHKATHHDLRAFLTAPKPNKSRDLRVAQLDKCLAKITDDITFRHELNSLPITQEFIQKGHYGIRQIERAFNAYRAVKQSHATYASNTIHPINHYIAMSATDPLNTVMTTMQNDYETTKRIEKEKREHELACEQRRSELLAALQAKGLQLRQDSQLCHNYIQGRCDKTLDEVVIVMENMKFLHTYTDYQHLMKQALRHAYDLAKDYVYDMHGYVEDPDEYDLLVEEQVDVEAIRADCQTRAVQRFIKQSPNRAHLVPQGLHHLL